MKILWWSEAQRASHDASLTISTSAFSLILSRFSPSLSDLTISFFYLYIYFALCGSPTIFRWLNLLSALLICIRHKLVFLVASRNFISRRNKRKHVVSFILHPYERHVDFSRRLLLWWCYTPKFPQRGRFISVQLLRFYSFTLQNDCVKPQNESVVSDER